MRTFMKTENKIPFKKKISGYVWITAIKVNPGLNKESSSSGPIVSIPFCFPF